MAAKCGPNPRPAPTPSASRRLVVELTEQQELLLCVIRDLHREEGQGLNYEQVLHKLVHEPDALSLWYFYAGEGGVLHSDEVAADLQVLLDAGLVQRNKRERIVLTAVRSEKPPTP